MEEKEQLNIEYKLMRAYEVLVHIRDILYKDNQLHYVNDMINSAIGDTFNVNSVITKQREQMKESEKVNAGLFKDYCKEKNQKNEAIIALENLKSELIGFENMKFKGVKFIFEGKEHEINWDSIKKLSK